MRTQYLNMLPVYKINDAAYTRLINIKFSCELPLSNGFIGVVFSYVRNLFFSKLALWKASSHRLTSFIAFIFHVFCSGAQKKMLWIYAKPVVAFMKHAKRFIKIRINKFITNSVSLCSKIVYRNSPIPIRILPPGPDPAARGFANIAPEFLFKHIHMLTVIPHKRGVQF